MSNTNEQKEINYHVAEQFSKESGNHYSNNEALSKIQEMIENTFVNAVRQLEETKLNVLCTLNLPKEFVNTEQVVIGNTCNDVKFNKMPTLHVEPGWYRLPGLDVKIEVRNFSDSNDIVILHIAEDIDWMSKRLFLELATPVSPPTKV